MSAQPIKRVVILGGGSAGWLTAGVLAAEHMSATPDGVKVTVIESPNVSPIGVGEGTWPTMRTTLSKIGVTETDFFRHCDASFKQGIKFVGWVDGNEGDAYYHPLELPRNFNKLDLVTPWQRVRDQVGFADATCFQPHLCERNLAPKQISTPEYAAVANYAYHFSSVKLGPFLAKHCTEKLGVVHVVDDVVAVDQAPDGDISALQTQHHGKIEGDLFVDCSGMSAFLLGRHMGVDYRSKKHVIYNDRALAVQVPYASPDDPIASHTVATAQQAGWIWDIGLPSRRGVGHVYASDYTDDSTAEAQVRAYIAESVGQAKAEQLEVRKIQYQPGHRERFWHRNCVAIGMSAGFVEPLEATALIMIEAAANALSADLPASREVMDIIAERFNRRFTYYWDTTIDFLKLQYLLTKRSDTAYWRDCRRPESVPQRLQELLTLWRHQVPNRFDFPLAEEMLPAASWQYILYGMEFVTEPRPTQKRSDNGAGFQATREEVAAIAKRYAQHLPTNRQLITQICRSGLSPS